MKPDCNSAGTKLKLASSDGTQTQDYGRVAENRGAVELSEPANSPVHSSAYRAGDECAEHDRAARVACEPYELCEPEDFSVEPSGVADRETIHTTLASNRPAQAKQYYQRKALIVLAGVVAIVGCAAFVWNQYSAQKTNAKTTPSPAVVTVTTVNSASGSVDDTISVTGTVAAWDPLQVGAEVSGLRIVAVEAEEGDRVHKGQVLCRLNSSLLNAQLQQAKAHLLSNQANLKKAIQPNRPEEITALKAVLAHAEATVKQEEAKHSQARVGLANAELNASRYAELARMGATSSQDAEAKQVLAETAREEIAHCDARIRAAKFMTDQARERLLAAQRGGRREDVDISQATIEETRAQVRHLEEQIAQTIIRAPDDGVITRRDAHIGNITSSGTPLFQLIRQNRHELRAAVSDLDLGKFKPGQEVSISSTETDTADVKGIVRLIIPQVDAVTRLGTVRIELPADAKLHPGMFVRGSVKLGTRVTVTVPVDAVVTRNGESFVFVLSKENRALSRLVKTGSRADKIIEIKQGLAVNEPVIVKGARFLADRDIVRVAP